MTKPLTTIAIILTAQACLAAQQISSAPEGKALFAEQCASCHGADAQGSDRAPKLAGSRSLHGQSTEQIRGTIQHGIAAGGMPAFPLPVHQLDALAAFVHSLNTEEAGSVVSGDAAAGEPFSLAKASALPVTWWAAADLR